VLVTGASRGIGAATARCRHRDGATVLIHYGTSSELAQALAESLGDRVALVQGDLRSESGAPELWAKALSTHGRIDALVNNAGAWIATPIDNAGAWWAWWHHNISLNLASAAELCRLAILHFQERGGGTIVNVTSRSAHRGDDRDHLAYGASKAGLLGLTKGIARGFGSDGVLAYAVAPGWVDTDPAVDELATTDLSGLPLGGPTPPEGVAETIAFLVSGRAPHVTGATIDITGADYVR
jgi:NAD(P)-dependent dehydrogenase (short-subunit alcohol dehydrogenase family)